MCDEFDDFVGVIIIEIQTKQLHKTISYIFHTYATTVWNQRKKKMKNKNEKYKYMKICLIFKKFPHFNYIQIKNTL